ncbi:MAG: M61 family metallopeptidase [Candidatus Heimdallarchaeota archaeon]|nr:M61 family metallopeptidase [Candidatus Heimdallarchaeota archaeon]
MFVEFTVDLTHPEENLIGIQMNFRSPVDNPIIEMPVWTPGSYLIREYSRHIQKMTSNVESHKVSKNCWKLKAPKGTMIQANYQIYAFELTVRTNYFDNRKLLLSPAACFMYVKDAEQDFKAFENRVMFKLNIDWKIFTSLKKDGDWYIAHDFDELVDSPVAGGVSEILDIFEYMYEPQQIPNTVVLIGDKGDHDMINFIEDLKRIQINHANMMGDLPYDRYLWALYVVGSGGGGLEHKYSNFSIIPRFSFRDRKKYTRLLSLESHEHFHVYNIKRIRPQQLGPFEYGEETYTKLLWVAEGMTSFYDKISLIRAGLITEEEYLEMIASSIHTLDNIPGRTNYSLEEASFDAWIKLYRANENTNNSSVSYYLKGSIVAFCLDLEIRQQTSFNKSLDDFFKNLYLEYKKNKLGYDGDKIQELIETHTDTDLHEFFDKYIKGTEEIDYNFYLAMIGYELKPELSDEAFTGIKFKEKTTIVQYVYKNSPANEANIYYNDEIVSIDGYRAKNNWNTILKLKSEGEGVDITLFRDDKILTTKLILEKPQAKQYKIVDKSDITDDQKSNRAVFFNS